MAKKPESSKTGAAGAPRPQAQRLQEAEDAVAQNVLTGMDWFERRMAWLLERLQGKWRYVLAGLGVVAAAVVTVVVVLGLEPGRGPAAPLAEVQKAEQAYREALEGKARDPEARLQAFWAQVRHLEETYRQNRDTKAGPFLAIHLAQAVLFDEPADDLDAALEALGVVEEVLAPLRKDPRATVASQAEALLEAAGARRAWWEAHGPLTLDTPPPAPPAPVVDPEARPLAAFTTTRSHFVLELFDDAAPGACTWFLSLVKGGMLLDEGRLFDVEPTLFVRFGVPFEQGNDVDRRLTVAETERKDFRAADAWPELRNTRPAPQALIAPDAAPGPAPDREGLLLVNRRFLAQHGREFLIVQSGATADALKHLQRGYEVFGRLVAPKSLAQTAAVGEKIVAARILRWRRADDPLAGAPAAGEAPKPLPQVRVFVGGASFRDWAPPAAKVAPAAEGEAPPPAANGAAAPADGAPAAGDEAPAVRPEPVEGRTPLLPSFVVELFLDECPNTVANFLTQALGPVGSDGRRVAADARYRELRIYRAGGELEAFGDATVPPLVEFGSLAPDGQWEEGRWLPLERSFRRHGSAGGRLAMRVIKKPTGGGDVPSATRVYITRNTDDSFDKEDARTIVFGRVIEGMDVVRALRKNDRLLRMEAVADTVPADLPAVVYEDQ